jgi:hypothetical protein
MLTQHDTRPYNYVNAADRRMVSGSDLEFMMANNANYVFCLLWIRVEITSFLLQSSVTPMTQNFSV